MPLPFLATDSGQPDRSRTADAARPHAGQDTWMRKYRPGPLRVATAALLLMLAAYLLVASGIVALASGLSGAATWMWVAGLSIVTALRILRVGFWVSGNGVRQVGLFYTVTVPWDKVGRVHTAQQPVKWLGLPRTLQGQALVVTRSNGQQLRPLMTDHNADFLGRTEAFDMAADAVEAWAVRRR